MTVLSLGSDGEILGFFGDLVSPSTVIVEIDNCAAEILSPFLPRSVQKRFGNDPAEFHSEGHLEWR